MDINSRKQDRVKSPQLHGLNKKRHKRENVKGELMFRERME